MMKGQRHLTDDRLVEVCLACVPAADGDRRHLDACLDCQRRRDDLQRMLADVSDAVSVEADAAFSAERLARQHARIVQRLDHEGRPGRVIAFPAGHPSDSFALRNRPAMRWIAGAAAAGLVIGLLADHLAHDFSVIRPGWVSQQAAILRPAAQGPTLHAVATTISEDDFLGAIDLAIESSGSTALRPLDELTPRAWEATIP